MFWNTFFFLSIWFMSAVQMHLCSSDVEFESCFRVSGTQLCLTVWMKVTAWSHTFLTVEWPKHLKCFQTSKGKIHLSSYRFQLYQAEVSVMHNHILLSSISPAQFCLACDNVEQPWVHKYSGIPVLVERKPRWNKRSYYEASGVGTCVDL